MKLPDEFLQSLQGVPGFDEESFVTVHQKEEGVTSIRTNPAKWPEAGEEPQAAEGYASPLTVLHSPVPWSEYGRYLQQRPSFTFDPLFHAGCYYVQEASSMFMEQAVKQLTDSSKPLNVLDLCAAPGGKSTHLQSLLSPGSLVVSNEFIKQRSIVLTDNIIKWGCSNVFVANNDPKAFQKLGGFFDLMVVDAPCSGSGLFRKDRDAISEWSLHNVELCSQRQQRILNDALPSLKENGILVYSTCSYSAEENEKIMDWLAAEKGMENIKLSTTDDNIVVTESGSTSSTGYRFYPDKIQGEGFFLACFRKKGEETSPRWKGAKPDAVSVREKSILKDWVNPEGMEVVRFREGLSAVPESRLQDFLRLQSLLNMPYAGVALGAILKEKLVPHHALAQSMLLSTNVPCTDLPYNEAIRYLQRQDISTVPEMPGWQVVRFEKKPLGWINALKNRVNNYYPKEIRILKHNNTPFAK
jgi:16S rRNA C967 or C1407 C5-methylase (RsmB/RsmF family)/NOL1/NOP2/fmu family ribosome biogenesis protein